MVQTPVTTGFHACQVSAVRRDCDDSVVVTVEPPFDADWSFAHGQHLVFRREFDGVEIRRSYSLCSPAPDGPLRVAIRLVPGGVFSTWANTELAAGDTVEVMAPSGHFTHGLDPAAARRYLLVAGGSGITPLLSIAATVLATEPESRVTMLYVNRSTRSTMLLDDVEGLRNEHLGRFDLWYAFTQEHTALELLEGRPDEAQIQALIERGIVPTAIDHAFLCGPEGLVDLVTSVLTANGVAADSIHTELFTAGEGRAARPAPRAVAEEATPIADAVVTLHGRTSTVPMFEGDTVLEAAQRARPDVPYSCRAGVCSTCIAELTDGEVTMEISHGLDDKDRAKGYVLTCQSFPVTATVTATFDI